MKIFFLLILLTRNGAGDINASFVNTKTLQQCQQKSLMLANVFTASNISVVGSRCIQSSLQFSDFAHASSSNLKRYFYRINFDAKTMKVDSMPDLRTCMNQLKNYNQSGRVYCSSSIQSINSGIGLNRYWGLLFRDDN